MLAGASGSVSYQVDNPLASDFPLGHTVIRSYGLLSTNETPPIGTEAEV